MKQREADLCILNNSLNRPVTPRSMDDLNMRAKRQGVRLDWREGARMYQSISFPLMLRDDADKLSDTAKRNGFTIEWKHNDLINRSWKDGRYQAGDELPAPEDD